jgi:hypothetical protein
VVSNVELAFFPARQATWKLVRDVHLFYSLPQLKTSSFDYFYLVSTGLSSQMEKMIEQVEMGFYP